MLSRLVGRYFFYAGSVLVRQLSYGAVNLVIVASLNAQVPTVVFLVDNSSLKVFS